MPIRWSTLQVSESMNKVSQYVDQAARPLEQARLAAVEARKIPNLPGYVDQHLARLVSEIERVTGGIVRWNNEPYQGNIREAIESVRRSIPGKALNEEKEKDRQQSMTPAM